MPPACRKGGKRRSQGERDTVMRDAIVPQISLALILFQMEALRRRKRRGSEAFVTKCKPSPYDLSDAMRPSYEQRGCLSQLALAFPAPHLAHPDAATD
jgi:hypothetical protein